MTDETVAPLDAYQTAKPKEPTFTLQGGDPSAWALVETWAWLARYRAGGPFTLADELGEYLKSAVFDYCSEPDSEREELLLRATEAERVSWQMKAYLKGQFGAEPETSSENSLPVEARLELFELRTLVASRISNMFSELNEIIERLTPVEPWGEKEYLLTNLKNCFTVLRLSYNLAQPRRDRLLK